MFSFKPKLKDNLKTFKLKIVDTYINLNNNNRSIHNQFQ